MPDSLNKFRKFIGLSFADRMILIKSSIIVALIQIGLKAFSFYRFRNIYARIVETKKKIEYSSEFVERTVWAINTVSPSLRAECLPRALALKYFLRKDNSVKLLIGVNQKKVFAAHAWIEKGNRILIGELPGTDFQTLWNWN